MKVIKAHKNQTRGKEERWRGRSCLAFARAGLRYLYCESKARGDNLNYARGERMGKKMNEELKLILPATDRAASYAKRGDR